MLPGALTKMYASVNLEEIWTEVLFAIFDLSTFDLICL